MFRSERVFDKFPGTPTDFQYKKVALLCTEREKAHCSLSMLCRLPVEKYELPEVGVDTILDEQSRERSHLFYPCRSLSRVNCSFKGPIGSQH
jgi:hypothetical protein